MGILMTAAVAGSSSRTRHLAPSGESKTSMPRSVSVLRIASASANFLSRARLDAARRSAARRARPRCPCARRGAACARRDTRPASAPRTPSASPTAAQVASEPRQRAPAQVLVDALGFVEELVGDLGGIAERRDHDRRVEVVGERGARLGDQRVDRGLHGAVAAIAALREHAVDALQRLVEVGEPAIGGLEARELDVARRRRRSGRSRSRSASDSDATRRRTAAPSPPTASATGRR